MAKSNWGPKPIVPFSITLCGTNSTTGCGFGDPDPAKYGFCYGKNYEGVVPLNLLKPGSEGVRVYWNPGTFGQSSYIDVLCDSNATEPLSNVNLVHTVRTFSLCRISDRPCTQKLIDPCECRVSIITMSELQPSLLQLVSLLLISSNSS
jgi:hypothetical protein